jgi:hypothetical protein
MKRMLGMLIAIAGCASVLVAAPSPAAAAEGSWGSYATGYGYCWDDADWGGSAKRIITTPPVMNPAEDAPQPAGFFVGPPSQWVGFKVTLLRWNGSSWYRFASSALKVQQANWAFYSDNWYDHATGTWGPGQKQFSILYSGYYKLLYDLYWYGLNSEVTGHVAASGDLLRDDRLSAVATTGWSYVEWCKY